jgi:thioredoxin 1
MKKQLFFAALMATTTLSSFADIPSQETKGSKQLQNGIQALDTETFNSFINQENAVVEFFSEGCSHCRRMKPIYQEAALNSTTPSGVVDVNKYSNLANQAHIEMLPTFIVYKKGREVRRHQGEASVKDLKAFISSSP